MGAKTSKPAADMEMAQMAAGKESGVCPADDGGEATDFQPVNWKRVFFSWKYLPWWILAVLIAVATALITIKHDEVVSKLRPFSEQVRDLPVGWLIPIVILFVISFPPLFGHEIVALLCGVVYGLWIGFGIVCAGTFLGEIGTWFAFKYTLRAKAEKMERTNLSFASLARLTREGGFWIIFTIRFSAIPSHFSTAVFATCGVNFWFFAIATLLTLPKQLFLVYLGVLLLQERPDGSAKNIVFGVAFVVTIIMAIYIYYKMRGCKEALYEEQEARKHLRRLRKDSEAASAGSANSGGSASGSGLFQPGAYYQEEAQPLQGSIATSRAGGNRFGVPTAYLGANTGSARNGRPDEPMEYQGHTTARHDHAQTTPYPSDTEVYMPPEPLPSGPYGPAADSNSSSYTRSYPHAQYLLPDQPPSRPPTNSGHLKPVESKSWV